MGKKILVVGGAGYIGSHMVRTLLENKFQPIVFDNLSTGHRSFIPKKTPFIQGDLRNKKEILNALKIYNIETVMYFAASIVVSESVKNPLKYYENNVSASIHLIQAMVESKVKKMIFSSTAAVYGEPKKIPIDETEPTLPENAYGRSKLMVEEILKESARAYDFNYISLRYFNVAGSHPKADIGIKYKVVTHLIPSILKVASGERKVFNIFGEDYPTKDGTCIRDFIYVLDLCKAHLCALRYLSQTQKSDVFNLGNGNGFSVKQVLKMAEQVTGKKISTHFEKRRPGDPARVVASSKKAQKILGWKPETTLKEIVETAWKWECFLKAQSNN